MFWFKQKQSEVEYLRELVKELQHQVLIMASKHGDYINTKIALDTVKSVPNTVLNEETGLLQASQILSEQDKKDYDMAQEDLLNIASAGQNIYRGHD